MDKNRPSRPTGDRFREAGPPPAIVLNMYYTGLGIARSLGEKGVRVFGFTSKHGVYGNFTRYAQSVFAPDSRREPEALLAFLLEFGRSLGCRAVLFPTRDDDLLFADRYRDELTPYFSLVMPGRWSLRICLDKWETYLWAQRAGIPVPKCWKIEGPVGVRRLLPEVSYPCVLKPLSASHWRQRNNWELVGARKAIGIVSEAQLLEEYSAIAPAEERALLQEMIPGGDDSLFISACYLNGECRYVAGFSARKRVQIPEGFGTGCIVQSTEPTGLLESTGRMLEAMGFSGVAEVEYKWDARSGLHKLIEINPRPWDQHRLGHACGVDLIYMSYCEHAGRAAPALSGTPRGHKWIAEDAFILSATRLLIRRDGRFRTLLREARGKRIYAIWSARDPFPSIAFFVIEFLPGLVKSALRAVLSAFKGASTAKIAGNRGLMYENSLEKRQNAS